MFFVLPPGEEKMESIELPFITFRSVLISWQALAAAAVEIYTRLLPWRLGRLTRPAAKSLSARQRRRRRLYHLLLPRHDGWWDTLIYQSSSNYCFFSSCGLFKGRETPDFAVFLGVFFMCEQMNMSSISTFHSSHMLQTDWTLVLFTASTTGTKLSFNILEDLWTVQTSLISAVYSSSCFMGLCESLQTFFFFNRSRHIISPWRLSEQQTSARLMRWETTRSSPDWK